jgi:outer membrane autotransporter protein
LIAYGGYTADSWYLDLSGGVVQHKYDSTRVMDFTNFSGVASGSYKGVQSVLTAQGGYPIRLDAKTVLTPVAGLNYSKLKTDGYTETGGSGAALIVNANKATSLTSDLGAKLERSFSTEYGSLAPSAQLTWRHEYQDTRLRSVASYAADTSGATSFVTYGAKPITNTGIMALAATLTRSNNLTLTARYTLEAASGYKAQTADVRLRYQF